MRSIGGAALAVALLFLGAASAAAQQSQKFAYINSAQVLQQAPGRAEAEAQFQKELAQYQAEVKRMGDSLQSIVAAFDKESLVMSPAAKEARQKEIAAKEQEYQKRTAALEKKAGEREDELTRPILERIRKAIEAVRTEEGYAFIFDVAAGSAVVAADKNLEVTNQVLAKLREMSASSSTQPPGAANNPASDSGEKSPPGKP